MPGQRKSHRKTRNGCAQCKARRIKCDECKPSCRNCNRFNSTCSYLQTRPAGPGTGSGEPQHVMQIITPSPSAASPLTMNSSSETGGWEFKMLDFELLHFYTSTTSLTKCNLAERQYVWQNVVPKIAFKNTFLLHGILAFAALHLARLDPSRRDKLNAEASIHHNTALAAFRTVMSNINQENCNACFAFSSILVMYAWAAPDRGNLFFADTTSISAGDPQGIMTIEWVHLVRGACVLLEAAQKDLLEGPLRPLLFLYEGQPTWESEETRPSSVLEPEVRNKWEALRKICEPSEDRAELDAESVEKLKLAVDILEDAYKMLYSDDPRVCLTAVAFSWPVRVPEHYITMIHRRVPQALVVLAHYCLLLTKLDTFWWINGMSRHLLQTIVQTLGKKWEHWISWPLQDLVLCEFNNRHHVD